MTSRNSCVFACFLLCFCGLAFGQNGTLRITQPKLANDHIVMTSEPSIHLKGTLAWAGGDTRVLWKNERGFSDLATVTLAEDKRTVEWSTTEPIPLHPGINQVRIRALGQAGAEFVNIYYTAQAPPPPPRQRATIFKGRQIAYEEIDGWAVYQSDMILGRLDDVKTGKFAGRMAEGGIHLRPQSVTIAPSLTYASGLWPIVNGVVRVPYTIANTSGDVANINAAIAESNTQLAGVVQWVAATGSDVNLVSFNLTGPANGSCEAVVGMQGGSQPIGGASNCTVTTILHEMGHALGLYHEQSRADRNTWVNYAASNVDKPQHANFDILEDEADSGLYNYASIMEYGAFEFSRYGVSPVLETIPAGMVLGTDLPQYTTGDLDGIERLYGFFPSKITVDSNPTGLELVVDNVTCAAPCVFSNWSLGSQHTLSVSQTIQTLGTAPAAQSYLFGRWNSDVSDIQSATATVTNSGGNGSLLSPTTSPAITNYLASFIPLHPYNPQISANNGATGSTVGTIGVNPSPYNGVLNGSPTNYFKDRQQIDITLTPKAGYTFHHWANVSLPIQYSPFINFYITSNFDSDDMGNPVTADFVNDAVTTVTASSSDPDITIGISPGFSFGVVENSNSDATVTAYAPRNFDAFYDGTGFAAGKQLTLCGSGLSGTTCPATPVAQSPVTTNMTYTNYSWNGSVAGNANAVTVASIPAGGAQVNLNLTYMFREIILPSVSSQSCPGVQISTNPAGTNNQGTDGGLDAFYSGVEQAISAVGDPGVVNFISWAGDLGGNGSPYDQTLTSLTVATANYNVVGTSTPLTISSVSWPGSPGATSSATALTVTGTGFLHGSTAASFGVGGQFSARNTTVQSSTQLTVQLLAGDLASIGYPQLLIQNTGAAACDPQLPFTFAVSQSGGAPALAISKMHNGVFGPSQQNAQYTILVTNSGTAGITQPVTVTDTLPSGESLVSMTGQNGSGWSCNIQVSPPACTNSNTLAPQASYGTITVTVNVAGNATSPQVNSATASGGGAEPVTATDSTVIQSTVSTPNVTNEPQAAAETAIVNAGLTVGQVTDATSGTVPAGDVISTSPSGGVSVAPGTPVNIVVSIGATAVLQSIKVSPSIPSIVIGGTQQFTATGTYSDTSTQNLTTQVAWSSSKTSVATITSGAAGGLATGAGVGSSTISAALNSISGSATLTVTGSPCDLNQDGFFTVMDVQAMINEALGTSQASNDLNGDHVVNAVDIQIVINAALKLGCTV